MPETDKLFPRLREPKCFVDRPVPSELSAALERLAGLLGDLCGLSDSGDPYFVVQNRARTALHKLGWTPREEPPVCPTCGGSKEVRWRDAIVEDGQPFEVERRDLCPDCTPSTERGK